MTFKVGDRVHILPLVQRADSGITPPMTTGRVLEVMSHDAINLYDVRLDISPAWPGYQVALFFEDELTAVEPAVP